MGDITDGIDTKDCWVWPGHIRSDGYGTTRKGEYVHRVVYEHLADPIPEGLVVDHLCKNRACCNPNHLEAVTQGENVLRGVSVMASNARKTHCKHGHPFAGDNLRITVTGGRICRTCERDRHNANRENRNARQRARRAADPEKHHGYEAKYRAGRKDKRRAYYAANKEKLSARQAEYRAKNKDRVRDQNRKYIAANKDKIKARRRKHTDENRDEINARRRAARARKRAASTTATEPTDLA